MSKTLKGLRLRQLDDAAFKLVNGEALRAVTQGLYTKVQADIQNAVGDVDLSDLVTSGELDAVQQALQTAINSAIDQIPDVSDHVTEDRVIQIVEEALAGDEELIEMIENIVMGMIDEIINNLPDSGVTQQQVQTMIDNAITAFEATLPDFADFATQSDLDAVEAKIPTNVVTSGQLATAKSEAVAEANAFTEEHAYSKAETDEMIVGMIEQITGEVTEEALNITFGTTTLVSIEVVNEEDITEIIDSLA